MDCKFNHFYQGRMISLDNWRSRGRLRSLLGRDIFTIEDGLSTKGTVLLIHGFPTASWDWSYIWEALSANYRVVALDMLGFGFSDKPEDHTYSIMEQADIVEALVETMDLKNFHVLAHDYGDTVAQELLARQNAGTGKNNWESICFLNGGLFPETHQALLIQRLLLSPFGKLINKLSNQTRFNASVSRTFGPQSKPSPEELEAFWTLVNYNNGRHIFHKLITYMSDRKEHRGRWVAAIDNAKIPVALINGSYDPVSGAHMVARYHEILDAPDYLAQLAGIGHYPQVEAPEVVSAHYLKFLDQLSG